MDAASPTMSPDSALDKQCVNTLRFPSMDAMQKADSGHPGMPMGAASMGYVLWTRFLKHNPANPAWFDRDRFVLRPGHGRWTVEAATEEAAPADALSTALFAREPEPKPKESRWAGQNADE